MSNIIKDITEITRCGVQYRTDKLAPLGLKACHGSYLTEICAQPGISQEQLAQCICINKSNVARQVAILEEGGFLQRLPSWEDKRIMKLYPTQKTLDLLPKIMDIMDTWQNLLVKDLSQDEQELLEGLLEKMRSRASDWMEAQ